MAKIKSYTDIEQSKKLAKILPLESADMYYSDVPVREWIDKTDISKGTHVVFKSQIFAIENLRHHEIGEDDVYAWSLSTLLEVIPQEIFDGEYIINITEGCINRWELTYDHYENRNHSYYELSVGADNLVDACVEMILRLHILKCCDYEHFKTSFL